MHFTGGLLHKTHQLYQLLAATTGYYSVMAANWSICTSSDAYSQATGLDIQVAETL